MLRGYTVGVTADRRRDEQALLFERCGATVVSGPTVRIVLHGDGDDLRGVTRSVLSEPPAAVIVGTALGVRSWLGAAEAWGSGEALLRLLAETRIIARGPKAAGALTAHGLRVDDDDRADLMSDAVERTLASTAPGQAVAVVLDGRGPVAEVARLASAGRSVREVAVYESSLPDDTSPALNLAEGILAGRVHAITFTSVRAVENFAALVGEAELEKRLVSALAEGDVVVGCVGPTTARAAEGTALGAGEVVVAGTWRLGSMVRSVGERLSSKTVQVELGSRTLRMSGSAAWVDASELAVTSTEAQLLRVLAEEPGVVRAKAELLRRVWRDDSADPHVVEAAVARLRRRLVPAGLVIRAVYRRGYLLVPAGG